MLCLRFLSLSLSLSLSLAFTVMSNLYTVTGLGTPNYPALLSLFLGLP